jgi:subtilisin family serine protease
MAQALHALRAAGLRIVRIGRFAITAAGPARLVAAITGRPLALQINRSRSGLVGANRPGSLVSPSDLYVSLGGSGETASGRRFGHGVDDFVFVPPPIYFAPLPIPPAVGYPHLSDTDVRRLLRVPPDLDGTGVTVAMVDTGFQTSHPFYRAAGFDFQAVSTQSAPQADLDPDGHGTAMAWNVLAVAPGVALRGYKETTTAPLDAIEDAAAVADIISCSWGYDHEYSLPFLEAGVRGVVEDLGKIVLFASGNGHRAWPGTMPEIISVGGTHADPDTGALRASDYASGFISSLYRNRRVPDVCGLCGMRPGAVYLPLPVPAGSPQDVLCHGLGQPYGDGDETAPDDGWIYASGTSSATPQVAGVVALMLQKARREGKSLTPVDVKAILERSAQPVIAGTNFFGFPATNPPPSDAVGWGLVDAAAALALI